MAENVLETRILLRYGTYQQWMNSNVILQIGEAGICAFPKSYTLEGLSNAQPDYTPPAIGIKIGDGYHRFDELPWVQAVAADVYNWAKSSNKPTYTAQEIQGLQSYVENLVQGDVEVTIAPRIYQLVRGTGDNSNKYYLQYKENNEDGNWIVDTSTSIDLSDLAKLVEWVSREDLEDYPTLISRTATQIRYFLERLAYTDTEQSGYFVTAVSQANGKIEVSRARPTFNDITGVLNVSAGGTGLSSVPQDTVLVGTATPNLLAARPIAETVANNDYLVPNYLMKSYVESLTAGVTGAMHFIGEATVVIIPNSNVDPRINDYDFSAARPGDVILSEQKEFVWTGAAWNLLGDEGSYAVKGSITNVDISPEAAIDPAKINGLISLLDAKVDKESGKSLTSHDLTDELYEKLLSIENGAQQNTIEHIFLNDTEIQPVTINGLTRSINLAINPFTEENQLKLDSIEEGAQVNTIESIYINSVLQPIDHSNKQVNITIDQAALNLNVLEGAEVPADTPNVAYEQVEQKNKKLQLARITVTGNVVDLTQTNDTYILLDCGTSTTVI